MILQRNGSGQGLETYIQPLNPASTAQAQPREPSGHQGDHDEQTHCRESCVVPRGSCTSPEAQRRQPIPSDQALTVNQKSQNITNHQSISEGEPEELVLAQANRLPEMLCSAFVPTEHRIRDADS